MGYFIALAILCAATLVASFCFKFGSYIWRGILAAVAIFAVIGAIFSVPGQEESIIKTNSAEETLYLSCRLLEEDMPETSISYSGQLLTDGQYRDGAVLVQSMGLTLLGEYEAATAMCDKLPQGGLSAQILDLCESESAPQPDEVEEFTSQIKAMHDMSEEAMAEYEYIFKLKFTVLSNEEREEFLEQVDSRDDPYATQVKVQFMAFDDNRPEAVNLMAEAVTADDTLANRIIVTDMVANSYLNHDYSIADAEIDFLLEKVTRLQTDLERLHWATDTQIPDESKDSAQASKPVVMKETEYYLAREELRAAPISRAITYLEGAQVEYGDTLAFNLQMGKLYLISGLFDQATEYLDKAFLMSDDTEEWLSTDVSLLKDAYIAVNKTGDYELFSERLDALFDTMSQNSVVQTDANRYVLRETMNTYLRGVLSKLLIGSIDTTDFPNVAATLSYSGRDDEELSADMLAVADNGHDIGNFSLSKMGEGDLSICLVVDRSGSMSGEPLENAKKAVISFIQTVNPGTQLSLVSFESDARLEQALTNSTGAISSKVQSIVSTGGTNIAGGLALGMETLEGAISNKVIILLSDGYDGEPNAINPVLAELALKGIPVYTIGFGGVDVDYMNKIADATGGQFLSVESSEQLITIYPIIRGYIFDNYVLMYTVAEGVQEKGRSVRVTLKAENVYDEKSYFVGIPEENILAERDIGPRSDFYRQIGGSGNGGWNRD